MTLGARLGGVLAVAAACLARPTLAGAVPGDHRQAQREIALAEDARRWSDGVLAGYLKSPQAALRARAALAVGRLQDSTAVPALLPLAADPSPEVRREAVFALGQIGHRPAGGALAARLEDPDLETVDLALEALGKLGDKQWTGRVASFLTHGSALLRGEAAVALWRLADSTALEALFAAREDADPEVRWRVLYALEKIPAPDRVGLVAALGLQDDSPRVRAFAARTLGRQKAVRASAYLFQALGDADVDVVVNALRALQAIGDTLARAAVEPRLSHPHPYVRLTAATVLGALGSAAAAEALAAHLSDPDAATRGACARALLELRKDAGLPPVEPLLGDSALYARVAALDGLRFVSAAAALPRLGAGMDERRHLLERITCAEVAGALQAREMLDLLRAGLGHREAPHAAASAEAIVALRDTASLPQIAAAYVQHLADADADARLALSAALDSLGGAAYADSVRRRHPAPAPARAQPDTNFAEPPRAKGAVLRTTAGEIEWEFFGAQAPQTVKNFVRLAERGTFDGLAFHRVVPAFVIQDGDPTGTGWGGPGYTLRCEYNRLRYEAGMVGMAHSGKDTGGSQWFMTHTPQMHLNGRYTLFARVTRGMDVVARIVQGDRVEKVTILGEGRR